MFNILQWLDTRTPAPLMLEIPPFAKGMEPDEAAVLRRQERVEALIVELGPKWVGHPDHKKKH